MPRSFFILRRDCILNKKYDLTMRGIAMVSSMSPKRQLDKGKGRVESVYEPEKAVG